MITTELIFPQKQKNLSHDSFSSLRKNTGAVLDNEDLRHNQLLLIFSSLHFLECYLRC